MYYERSFKCICISYIGPSTSTHLPPTNFSGSCRDENDGKTHLGDKILEINELHCYDMCKQVNGCAAFRYKTSTRECRFYKHGPYMHGTGSVDYTCYIVQEGIF